MATTVQNVDEAMMRARERVMRWQENFMRQFGAPYTKAVTKMAQEKGMAQPVQQQPQEGANYGNIV